jgi:hypothetical protein
MPPRARSLPVHTRDVAPHDARPRRARIPFVAAQLFLTTLASACGSTRGALPALVIGGTLTHSASASTATDTAQTRTAWTARADVSLVWMPTSHTAAPAPARLAPRLRDDAAPCASAALCAWERLARTRALQRLDPETPTP